MAKPQALFIELKIQNKFRYTCDIIEKLYQDGLSVLVYTDDKKKADTLTGNSGFGNRNHSFRIAKKQHLFLMILNQLF